MAASRGTPLEGDRGAFDTVANAAKHALDIKNAALLRHLPAPGAVGTYARDNGTNWVTQLGLPLADMADYAQGSIIRGGAADWEAYDASGDGKVLIGDGTDLESRELVEADISDLDHTDADAAHVAEANTFTEGQSIETDATAAVPVLQLEQGDVSEEFLRLIGTSAADASQSLVDAADLTTPGALKGWIKVYIQDDAVSGAITDGVYYVPFYAAPTA